MLAIKGKKIPGSALPEYLLYQAPSPKKKKPISEPGGGGSPILPGADKPGMGSLQ